MRPFAAEPGPAAGLPAELWSWPDMDGGWTSDGLPGRLLHPSVQGEGLWFPVRSRVKEGLACVHLQEQEVPRRIVEQIEVHPCLSSSTRPFGSRPRGMTWEPCAESGIPEDAFANVTTDLFSMKWNSPWRAVCKRGGIEGFDPAEESQFHPARPCGFESIFVFCRGSLAVSGSRAPRDFRRDLLRQTTAFASL